MHRNKKSFKVFETLKDLAYYNKELFFSRNFFFPAL